MTKLIHLLIILTMLGCQSTQVTPTPLPSHIFSQSESKEIDLMLQEFESVICDPDEKNIAECYQAQYEKFEIGLKEGNIKTKIDSADIVKILSPLSLEVKNKLFKEDVVSFENGIYRQYTNDDVNLDSISALGLNIEESFDSLIEELISRSPNLRDSTLINQWPNISSPIYINKILTNKKKYDYSQSTERLVLAMYYITLNDKVNKKAQSRDEYLKPLTDKLKERSAIRDVKKKND